MKMMDYCKGFARYLEQEKHVSSNTLDSYQRDAAHFLLFLNENGVEDPAAATAADIKFALKSAYRDGESLGEGRRYGDLHHAVYVD